MLGLAMGAGEPLHLVDLPAADLDKQPIAVADHCFGCTAGRDSSAGGALN